MQALLDAVAAGRSLWLELNPSTTGTDLAQLTAALSPYDVTDPHVTLVFLGKGATQATVLAAMAVAASTAGKFIPLASSVGGVARFRGNAAEGDPLVLLVQHATIRAMRDSVIEQLTDLGVPPFSGFDFTPHMTLRRVPQTESWAIPTTPRATIIFDRLSVCAGDARATFSLRSE